MSDTAITRPNRTGSPEREHARVAPGRQPGASRRRHLRIPVNLPTTVRHAGGLRSRRPTAARVVDVSEGGAKIQVGRPLARGEWVTLDLPSRSEELRSGFKLPLSAADAERLGLPSGTVPGKVRAGSEQLPDGRYVVGIVFQKGPWGTLGYHLHEALPTIALALLLVLFLPVARLEEPTVIHLRYHPAFYGCGLAFVIYAVARIAVAVACWRRARTTRGRMTPLRPAAPP